MTPIIESGRYEGVIARCDTCGRTSGFLDHDEDHTWSEERREARATDGFGEWLMVWDGPASVPGNDSDMAAKVYCPDHRPAA